jgi:hypothetical protein
MEKRLMLTVIAVLLAVLPLAGAIPPTGSVVYGDSGTIVRSTSLPGENVHIEAQEAEIMASTVQMGEVQAKLAAVEQQLGDVKVSSENQRSEAMSQLNLINRELGAIKSSVDGLRVMQQQLSEIRPALEQPQEIIPPLSLTMLSVANLILLIVAIVLMFWLRNQYKATTKDAHLEEHAQIHLTDFIREAMHKGASLGEVRRRLVQRGWSEGKIDEAIQEVRTLHSA